MSIATTRHTVDEYFETEIASELHHEYLNGEIIQMTGGTRSHNLICNNLKRMLLTRFDLPDYWICTGDTRVKIEECNAYLYPDAGIVPGQGIREPLRLDSVLNPIHVFEVLSHSTERLDRGERFDLFRKISTLEKYVLISQTEISVECHSRQANGEWNF